MGSLYPPTWAGLSACFVAAIPFFGATLVSDVLWSVVLSLAYRALARRVDPRWVLVPSSRMSAV